MVSSPQRAIALVDTQHVFDAVKGSPRRPRGALGQFMAQRRAIERVGRGRVGKQRAAVEHTARTLGSRAYQDVVVQVGFTVAIKTVREAHDSLPAGRHFAVITVSSVTHHDRALFEVVQ